MVIPMVGVGLLRLSAESERKVSRKPYPALSSHEGLGDAVPGRRERQMLSWRHAVAALFAVSALGITGVGTASASPAPTQDSGTTTVTPSAGWCNAVKVLPRGSLVIRKPAYNGNPDCIMGVGASGWHVTALQDALRYCYNRDIAVDRQYGPRTKAALASVQGGLGLKADGVYGPTTEDYLKWPLKTSTGLYSGCSR